VCGDDAGGNIRDIRWYTSAGDRPRVTRRAVEMQGSTDTFVGGCQKQGSLATAL
jgi:hypothetical protein